LGKSPEVLETKAKIDKWNCTKFYNFYTTKEKKIIIAKRLPTEWEKIFANLHI
jgi:hypothetical protein